MRTLPLLLAAALMITGCDSLSDTVTSDYATLAEARSDNLFGRGWLPDVLPLSATNIRTSNDLDFNTSTGVFFFSPREAPQLLSALSRGAPPESKFANWQDTVQKYSSRGYEAWSYKRDGATWTFFCNVKKGKCEYFMW